MDSTGDRREAGQKGITRPRLLKEFGLALGPQVVTTSLYAIIVGFIAGLVAQGLLELIYLFTNVFFYGRWSFEVTYPVLRR